MSDAPIEATPPVPDPAGTVEAQQAEAVEPAIRFDYQGVAFTVATLGNKWAAPVLRLSQRRGNAAEVCALVLGQQFFDFEATPGKVVDDVMGLFDALMAANGLAVGEAAASAAS